MNRSDVQKMMAILEVSYPIWYSKITNEQLRNMVNLWTELLSETDPNLFASALKALILNDTSGFPPTIGQINNKAYELTHQNEMTEQEAWNMVYKAICNSGYNPKKEWDKLPDVLKALTTPEMLYEYSQMNADEVNTVISSNFMRSYKVRKEHVKQQQMLPESMKVMISEVTAKLRIGTTKEESE